MNPAPRLSRVVAFPLAALFMAAVMTARPAMSRAESAEAAEPAVRETLRLVVVLVVDQLRGDVLNRYGKMFGPDGLRKLSESGVWYRNAHYTHAHTVTGPGHATISTGARPAGHGIPSNDWFDRKTGAKVNCVGDSASTVLGTAGETGNASPANLTCTTFADEWILATEGRARAVGISGKDRGAILPVGKTGKAFWFSTQSGRMVSSTYFYKQLPEWAAAFDKKAPADRYFKKDWVRATRDDDGVPTGADDRPFEKDLHGMKRTFPHPLGKGMDKPESRFYEQVFASIYGDEIVMDFTLEALKALELGRKGPLDILTLSLSSHDSVGHNFGPDSVEEKEIIHGLDRQVGRLLGALDAQVGAGRYLLVLTADHGVGFSPEVLAAHGYSTSRFDSGDLLKRINRRLNFGVRYLDWSLGFAGPGYYFDPDALRYAGRPASELEDMVAEVVRDTPGVAAVFTRSDILAGRLPATDVARKVGAGFHPSRSPDVYMVSNAYALEGTAAASHGSPYSYDTHVPLIFYGGGLGHQEVVRPVDVMDIAPTISTVLRSTFPSASVGTPLPEVVGGVTRQAEGLRPRRVF
jgi:predicted AlkP superfamily pyrophosphatase or phosphodiesterase